MGDIKLLKDTTQSSSKAELRCKKHRTVMLRTRTGKPYCRACQRKFTHEYKRRVSDEIETARIEQAWQRLMDR